VFTLHRSTRSRSTDPAVHVRPVRAPALLPEVAEGVKYVNGERAKRGNEKAAA